MGSPTDEDSPCLPPDENLRTVYGIGQVAVQLRADHQQETTSLQKTIDHVTCTLGRPSVVTALAVAIFFWIAANSVAPTFGYVPIDAPPFVFLQGFSSMASFVFAVLILTTQRREDELASHRSQLMLELAVLSEKKLSKVIDLLEEGRRDNPAIADRVDAVAQSMSTPSDTQAVLEAIKDIHDVLHTHQSPPLK